MMEVYRDLQNSINVVSTPPAPPPTTYSIDEEYTIQNNLDTSRRTNHENRFNSATTATAVISLATLTYQRLGVVVVAVTLGVELGLLRAPNVVQSVGLVQAGDKLTRLLLAFLRRIMRIGLSFSASAR